MLVKKLWVSNFVSVLCSIFIFILFLIIIFLIIFIFIYNFFEKISCFTPVYFQSVSSFFVFLFLSKWSFHFAEENWNVIFRKCAKKKKKNKKFKIRFRFTSLQCLLPKKIDLETLLFFIITFLKFLKKKLVKLNF